MQIFEKKLRQFVRKQGENNQGQTALQQRERQRVL